MGIIASHGSTHCAIQYSQPNMFKETPPRSCHVPHLKKIFFENLYFLVTNVFSVSKVILWYLNMSSIDFATWFKIGMYLLNREKRYQCFSEINRYSTSFKLIAIRSKTYIY